MWEHSDNISKRSPTLTFNNSLRKAYHHVFLPDFSILSENVLYKYIFIKFRSDTHILNN